MMTQKLQKKQNEMTTHKLFKVRMSSQFIYRAQHLLIQSALQTVKRKKKTIITVIKINGENY